MPEHAGLFWQQHKKAAKHQVWGFEKVVPELNKRAPHIN
jgi:hypothetical protein